MSIIWLGKVGCCEHGTWSRDTEYSEPNLCSYCNEEARTPGGKILKELEEIKRALERR